jgi:hypothetical protein
MTHLSHSHSISEMISTETRITRFVWNPRSTSNVWSCNMRECSVRNQRQPTYTSPLMNNNHPELDTTKLLDDDGIHQYQSLISVLQWTIMLRRFNIATAVMTMSGFRIAQRQGHLDRLKRICGYLSKMRQGCIQQTNLTIF